MKISSIESGKAVSRSTDGQTRILPSERPRSIVDSKSVSKRQLSPLEKGMLVAEAALSEIPDVREDVVNDIKSRISRGEYKVSGEDVADMMLRRLSADRIR